MKQDSKNMVLMGCGLVASGAVGYILLGGEAIIVLKWWLMMVLMGIGMLPLSQRIMGAMNDQGYFTGKMLGIAVTGYLTWLMSYLGIPFTGITALLITVLTFIGVWSGSILYEKKRGGIQAKLETLPITRIYVEELSFLLLMLIWGYLIGFKPQAFGTEKMMDYGFVAAMMNTTHLPAKDMWYSEGIINYYYGGQYYTAFLAKLSFTSAHYAYNLMRVLISAATFVMAYSIGTSLLEKAGFAGKENLNAFKRNAGGILTGLALCCAGNMHYVIIGKLVPIAQELLGLEARSYWFPDATRYIGYYPDVADKTIHEFPSYSFVLGDLHAHMINIIFVLPMMILLFNFIFRAKEDEYTSLKKVTIKDVLADVIRPEIIVMTLLIAIYQWTNYWDYPIYFGLAGLVILFTNIRKYKKNIGMIIATTIGQAIIALGLATLMILPFTLGFDSIFSGVAMVDRHTKLYQWLVLWGLPVITTACYIVATYIEHHRQNEQRQTKKVLNQSDLFVIILGIWALVLLMVPETMYVKDIYGDAYQRSNTMFKFTYQAYMMLAITTGYAIVRMLNWKGVGSKQLNRLAIVSLVLTLWTCGYFTTSVKSWFGDVTKLSGYQTLDATAFIERDYAANAGAIRYVEANVPKGSVVLEANGDSYTEAAMCSAMTGFPTVLGWYTHEWLWRNDTDDLNVKVADIQTIYTSSDVAKVSELLEQYDVDYIFVGSNEWNKYGTVNCEILDQIGTVVFTGEVVDAQSGQLTRIYKVEK